MTLHEASYSQFKAACSETKALKLKKNAKCKDG